MKPTVTILIPFYNPGSYLIEAIESVYKQTYTDWKILLIDDASTDQSASLIKKYLKDKERVTLITNSENVGQVRSMNIGLRETTTPYLLQLDADDWLPPDCLEVLVNAMNQQPDNVCLVSGNIEMIFENKRGEKVKSIVKRGRPFKNKYRFLRANSSVWPRFYRTVALREVGGWPTDGPYDGRYAEDLRILFRLIEKYQFHWVNKVLYYHRRHLLNQTNLIKIYAETTEWIVRDTLERWGNLYEPVFKTDSEGWKLLKSLRTNQHPKRPKSLNRKIFK